MTQDDPQTMPEAIYPQAGANTGPDVCQECHTPPLTLDYDTIRRLLTSGEGLVTLSAQLIALNLSKALNFRDFGSINGAVTNVLRIPEATREGGALAISSDYIEIMEIVRRLKQLPLETQELVVKTLFGERVRSEVSPGDDPSKENYTEHNERASCHV